MMTFSRLRAVLACATCGIPLILSTASAQPLTAQRAVEIALQHNSQIVGSEADVNLARSRVYGSASGVLPHITGFVSRGVAGTQGLPIDELTPTGVSIQRYKANEDFQNWTTQPALSGSWAVLDLSAMSSLSSARGNLKSVELLKSSTRNDVTLATRQRFYDVVTAVHLARVAASALQVARDDERRVRALFDVGSVSRSDVLQAQVRTSQGELDSLSAIQNITVTRVQLAQQIGIPEEQMGEVDTVLTAEPVTYDEKALLEEAAKNRPDIQAAELSLKSANAAVNAARYRWLPYVTLNGQASFSPTSVTNRHYSSQSLAGTALADTSTSDWSKPDRTYSASVALNLDIFDGLNIQSQAAAAKSQLLNARENRDALRRNLSSAVHGTLLVYREAIEREVVARSSVESAAENLNLTQQKYNVGSATILDLLAAEAALQRAQTDAVTGLAQLRVAEALIERVRGSGR